MRAKSYSYLINDGSEDKKAKATNKCVIKRKRKVEEAQLENKIDHLGKNKIEEAQLENKINHLGKNKHCVNTLKEDHKQFIKNKLRFKTQQRFRSGKHRTFIEETNKIALSSNVDKRIQSIGSRETYAYETTKDLACNKKETKGNNIMKHYKNV